MEVGCIWISYLHLWCHCRRSLVKVESKVQSKSCVLHSTGGRSRETLCVFVLTYVCSINKCSSQMLVISRFCFASFVIAFIYLYFIRYDSGHGVSWSPLVAYCWPLFFYRTDCEYRVVNKRLHREWNIQQNRRDNNQTTVNKVNCH